MASERYNTQLSHWNVIKIHFVIPSVPAIMVCGRTWWVLGPVAEEICSTYNGKYEKISEFLVVKGIWGNMITSKISI